MKRLLFFEGLTRHEGHKSLNIPLLDILSKRYETHTLCFKGWYLNLNESVIQHYYKEKIVSSNPRVQRTVASVQVINEVKRLNKEFKFDIIIISTFSYWSTFMWKWVFTDRNALWVLHHHDLDMARRNPYDVFFKLFVKRYVHLCLDEFIVDGMKKRYPSLKNRIFELKNPYRRMSDLIQKKTDKDENEFLCVSIGRGVNRSFIEGVIKYEEENGFLLNNNIRLYIKSKDICYSSKSIEVSGKYLSDDEYGELLCKADAIFVCYEEDYVFRMSGLLLDGLSSRKYVIGTPILVNRVYAKRYPNVCMVINSVSEFFFVLDRLKKQPCPQKEFDAFFVDHGEEVILNQLEIIEREIEII